MQSFKHFRVQYEVKRKQFELATQSVRKDGKLSLDQAVVKQAWERVTSRVSGKLLCYVFIFLLNEGWSLKSFKHLFAIIDFIRH